MNITKKVLDYFQSKGPLPGNTEDEYLKCKYLDIGLLDSMQLVEMIVLFEKEFKIRFLTKEMQSEEFRSIGGLIEILNRHLKKTNSNNA